MKILSKSATVKTVSVTIRALTVEGKQVTLAVFRQLQTEDIIDEDTGELRGVPWGRVNYHQQSCPQGDHLHIVWQKGEELRQAIEGSFCRRSQTNRDLFDVEQKMKHMVGALGYIDQVHSKYDKDKVEVQVGHSVFTSLLLSPEWMWVPSKGTRQNDQYVIKSIREELAGYGCKGDLDWLQANLPIIWEEVKRLRSQDEAIKRSYALSWQSLSGLEQLFIAV